MERSILATTDRTEAPWRAQLQRLLVRLLAARSGASESAATSECGAEKTVLRGLGVDLRETFTFVMERQPTLDVLERWIEERRGGPFAQAELERLGVELQAHGTPDAASTTGYERDGTLLNF
jgi:hypothetical protein